MLIKIPKPQHDAAKKLLTLTDEQWDIFFGVLEKVSVDPDYDRFMAQFVSLLDETDIPSFVNIVELITRVISVKFTLKLNAESFVDEFILAAKTDNLISNNFENVKNKLLKLFAEESPLCQAAKMRDLMADRPNIVENVRILSDIRAIFSDSADSKPQSFLIQHTLRLFFQSVSRVDEIYFSLDSESLRVLANEIDRAVRKEEKLVEFINDSGASAYTGYIEDQNR